MKGNEVKKLMDALVPAGKYNLVWGGDDESGEKVVNGTYLISIIVNGNLVASEKVVKNGK
jgi:flagellar hook assembly protein FlgD